MTSYSWPGDITVFSFKELPSLVKITSGLSVQVALIPSGISRKVKNHIAGGGVMNHNRSTTLER